MDYRYQLIEEEPRYRGFLKLHRHRLRHASFRGGWCPEIVRERLEGLEAVSVLLYDAPADAVVLVEQFRVGLVGQVEPPWTLETVSGFCDRAHESPEAVARREVSEETGLRLRALDPIGAFFVSPGISVERIHLFLGQVDSAEAGGVHGLADEGEEIRVVVLPREQALAERFGRIASTSVLVALQWLELERLKGRFGTS